MVLAHDDHHWEDIVENVENGLEQGCPLGVVLPHILVCCEKTQHSDEEQSPENVSSQEHRQSYLEVILLSAEIICLKQLIGDVDEVTSGEEH